VWPTQIADALRALIHHANTARDNGGDAIDPTLRADLLHTLNHGVLSLDEQRPHQPAATTHRSLHAATELDNT
jgi:hypothetical protein